jgi:hypothetical protein
MLAIGGFVLLAAGVHPSTPAAVPAQAVATVAARPASGGAKPGKVVTASLDPTLHMDAMLVTEAVEYQGSGRNIFSVNSVPLVAIPQPVSKPRPDTVATVAPPPPVPCPPNCPPPPPPPPIPLKFFGVVTNTATGKRQAFLLHDDDVYPASQGDIVLRRYRIVALSANSIQVEDMTSGNKQTLPLQAQ